MPLTHPVERCLNTGLEPSAHRSYQETNGNYTDIQMFTQKFACDFWGGGGL